MKGISTLIAVILILLITIALVALLYLWFTGIFTGITETGQEQFEESQLRLMSSMAIESVIKNNIYVRNTGSVNITEIVVYVNDLQTEADVPEVIEDGKVGIIDLTSPLLPGNHKVKVTSRYTEAEGWFSIGNIITVCKSGCDAETIQGGLDLARVGVSVMVTDKETYNEQILFPINNITLDCNGSTISVEDLDYAVNTNLRENLLIQNCIIENGNRNAIHIDGMNNIIQYNNILNSKIGIMVIGSYHTIINNIISSNSEFGLYINGVQNKIENNNVNSNKDGIYVSPASHETTINNNVVCENTNYDIGCMSTVTGSGNNADNVLQCPNLIYTDC